MISHFKSSDPTSSVTDRFSLRCLTELSGIYGPAEVACLLSAASPARRPADISVVRWRQCTKYVVQLVCVTLSPVTHKDLK